MYLVDTVQVVLLCISFIHLFLHSNRMVSIDLKLKRATSLRDASNWSSVGSSPLWMYLLKGLAYIHKGAEKEVGFKYVRNTRDINCDKFHTNSLSLILSPLLTSGCVETCFSLLSAVTTNWANNFLRMSSPGEYEARAATSSRLLAPARLPALAIRSGRRQKRRKKTRKRVYGGV